MIPVDVLEDCNKDGVKDPDDLIMVVQLVVVVRMVVKMVICHKVTSEDKDNDGH